MSDQPNLGLFAGFGVELEYMIVDGRTLAVKPICDALLKAVAGEIVGDVEFGDIAWSNELTLHVVELKTNGPAPSLRPLAEKFQTNVDRINQLLRPRGARLMPSAMHPLMNPHRETRLWPHEYSAVYETYDRIFDCRGHGWANLQSVHLNLPFAGDEEFGRLHAAIRLLLPLLPALAASSPLAEGKLTGSQDTRMDYYRTNSKRIPSVAGSIVPEPAYDAASYDRDIFQPMYADVAPYDPEGILQHEFLNSRGAIARFDRGAIEIRVLDVQECPLADVAICALIERVLRRIVAERWSDLESQKKVPTGALAKILFDITHEADRAVVNDGAYLAHFGISEHRMTAGDLWRRLIDDELLAADADPGWRRAIDVILRHGPLSRRIVAALGKSQTPEHIRDICGWLCDCLAKGTMFTPHG